MDKYSQALLNSASRLDATVGACGEITKLATAVVEEKSKVATIAFLQKISEMIDGDQKEIKLVAQTVNSTLLQFYGYSTIKDICKPAAEEPEDKKSLQELLEELNALVGLKQVKEKVHDLIVYQQVQKMRREKNLHSAKNTLPVSYTHLTLPTKA